jgi:alpha,alpha-trehalose phosphorylase
LSACTQAVIAAEVGHVDLAYDYLGETALVDLNNLAHNTRDGVHMASLAGAWIALIAGFGGVRNHHGVLTFQPRLPDQLRRLRFGVGVNGQFVRVTVTPDQATYELDAGEPVDVVHHGHAITIETGRPVSHPIPHIEPGPRPSQPAGRAPLKRNPAG